jgi:hypothetical protein
MLCFVVTRSNLSGKTAKFLNGGTRREFFLNESMYFGHVTEYGCYTEARKYDINL